MLLKSIKLKDKITIFIVDSFNLNIFISGENTKNCYSCFAVVIMSFFLLITVDEVSYCFHKSKFTLYILRITE